MNCPFEISYLRSIITDVFVVFSIKRLVYYVRLILLGKPEYKPAGLNADRFSMPYGTVTAL